MLKKILFVFFLAIVVSCAPFIKTSDLNSIKPGISKSDFVKTYGEPKGTNYSDGYYFLSYFVARDAMDDYQEYIFAFDENDRLAGWRVQNDTGNTTTGLLLTFPIPSGQ